MSSPSPSASSSPPRKRKRESEPDEIEIDVTAPEPPSKKALRQARKQSQPPNPNRNTTTVSTKESEKALDSDEDQAGAESSTRSEHGIWIGNLSFKTDQNDLRVFFAANLIFEKHVTRIHMPIPKTAEKGQKPAKNKPANQGFAYVDFDSAETLAQALKLTESLLAGRRLLIKDAKSFEGRPAKSKTNGAGSGHPPNKRIYVGNLGFDTTKEDLEYQYSKCGTISDVHVATFEDSGKCKGFAWVTFTDQEAASAAVQGYVMIEEESVEGEDDDESTKKKPKKKTRKWWVNRIKGRPLKAEFAESKSDRYKKRFGKGNRGGKGHDANHVTVGEEPGRQIDYTLGSNEPTSV